MSAVKRQAPGLYTLAIEGRTFEIYQPEGARNDWRVSETTDGKNEYWNSYWTKRDALASFANGLED